MQVISFQKILRINIRIFVDGVSVYIHEIKII